jgi:hypothetical protein
LCINISRTDNASFLQVDNQLLFSFTPQLTTTCILTIPNPSSCPTPAISSRPKPEPPVDKERNTRDHGFDVASLVGSALDTNT